ncbi:30S ribosomal protein S19 [Candidatus Micrarchaeota archaeon]|nr:MAG: 30S ribosomal protein S19 [Candidatus Micrarchaeota archaeon]
MARRKLFKGKSLEELQALSLEEFKALVDSRARRFLNRNNKRLKKLLAKVERAKKAGKDELIKTHVREAVVLPSWVGLKFGVHNGKEFKIIVITSDMIGRRLGEFSHSTGRVLHSGPGVGATRGSKFIPLK